MVLAAVYHPWGRVLGSPPRGGVRERAPAPAPLPSQILGIGGREAATEFGRVVGLLQESHRGGSYRGGFSKGVSSRDPMWGQGSGP